MHSLSKTKPEVDDCAAAAATAAVTSLPGCHRSVTSSTKAVERRTDNGLAAASDWKLTVRTSNDNAATRATSVNFIFYYFTIILIRA